MNRSSQFFTRWKTEYDFKTFVTAAQKHPLGEQEEPARNRVYLTVSILLLLLNISLVIPVSMMVLQRKPVSLTLTPAIAMAVYTTYKITTASVHLGKRKRSQDSLVRLLRTINFIEALVSLLTLQNTLIMINTSGADLSMLPLTAVTSAVVWVTVLVLSVSAIINGIKQTK